MCLMSVFCVHASLMVRMSQLRVQVVVSSTKPPGDCPDALGLDVDGLCEYLGNNGLVLIKI